VLPRGPSIGDELGIAAAIAEFESWARSRHDDAPHALCDTHYAELELLLGAITRAIEAEHPHRLARTGPHPPAMADVRAALWPHARSGPLTGWAIAKPLGYPGDYRMMEMILHYRRSACGVGALFDEYFHRMPGPQCVMRRYEFLAGLVARARRRSGAKEFVVVDVGCGPAIELELAAKRGALRGCRVVLVDRDDQALERAAVLLARADSTIDITLRPESVLRYLDQGEVDLAAAYGGRADVLVSVGLMDYMNESRYAKLLSAFGAALADDGVLVVGNLDERASHKVYMEWVLDWWLHYRSADAMAEPLAGSFDGRAFVTLGNTPANNFLVACRRSGRRLGRRGRST
jgi:extracellular factor (EF) 3-hydroxypalmitic acid methyl ester biosynthesis protein